MKNGFSFRWIALFVMVLLVALVMGCDDDEKKTNTADTQVTEDAADLAVDVTAEIDDDVLPDTPADVLPDTPADVLPDTPADVLLDTPEDLSDTPQDCTPACQAHYLCVSGACQLDPAFDHATLTELAGPFESGPAVTAACIGCHDSQANDFLMTAHWNWVGPTPGVAGHETGSDLGKANTINSFCVSIAANEGRCTQCHAGYGWANKNFDFTNKGNIDCLVCHDGSGQYKKAPTTAGLPDPAVDLVAAAQSVAPPTRANCGTCHFFAGGGDNVKQGDLYTALLTPDENTDVHMGRLGFQCTECHKSNNHKITGSGLPSAVEEGPRVKCTDCHAAPVHNNTNLDSHTAHVACQTCHIPAFSRQAATKMDWRWEAAGDATRTPVNDANGKPDYDKMKGEFIWAKNVRPTYAWYDGTSTRMQLGDVYTTTPVDMGSPKGDITNLDARITPFKFFTGNQPADTVNNVVLPPHLFGMGAGPNPYWVAYDWALALQEGANYAGIPYSGTFGFVDTSMYLSINHEVAPKAQALGCSDCHNGGIDFTTLGYTGDPMTVGGR
ncbi:MAG: cytochrome C [Deltaproteobacteria bacterium CG_4_9_14_3_um_filter_63_12]|nr:MAG: cytochrome C [Deltaproteobacteria bacterium CG_4_9_14_3_um_filter_63_12]